MSTNDRDSAGKPGERDGGAVALDVEREFRELCALDERRTQGKWAAADWTEDDGPNKTTVETSYPKVLHPGQSSIWPGGIAKSSIAETYECHGKPLEDAAFIAAAPRMMTLLRHLRADTSAQLDRLRGEFTALKLRAVQYSDETDQLRRDFDAAQTENESLRAANEALRRQVGELETRIRLLHAEKYANKHLSYCATFSGTASMNSTTGKFESQIGPCTCGYEQYRAALTSTGGEGNGS